MTIINSVVDLHVPGEYSTIQAACDMAASLNIGPSGLVRIIVADGVRDERNITPRVVNWQRFQIIGNESNPDACVINLDASDNASGFVAVDGYGIGCLNGFTINGYNGWVSDGVWNNQCYGSGILAYGTGSTIVCGSRMWVNRVYYGFRAKFGAHIQASFCRAAHCGDCGFHAYAATILAYGAYAGFCQHTNGENLGFGFCAESAGHIECERSDAEGCQVAGFYSLGNASMWAHGCESFRNIGHGFYALNGGYLEANGHPAIRYSNAFDNGGSGYKALNGGIMQTSLSYADRNAGGNYSASNQGLFIS